MDILFSAHIKNREQAGISQAILEMLSSQQNKLVIFTGKNKYSKAIADKYESIRELTGLQRNPFDLILAYTPTGLQQLKPFARQSGIPIIHLINVQDIEQGYPNDLSPCSKIILLNAPNDYPGALFQKGLMVSVQLPLKLGDANCFEIKDRKTPRLLVCIENRNLEYTPLYRLVPLLNTLVNFKINILYGDKPLPHIFNSNINLLEKSKADVEKVFEESDIVIGSGNNARLAVSKCKPCIIAGEQGYGGIIDPESFELQHVNDFRGRLGGHLNEHLPEKLILEDILDLLEWDQEKVNEIVQANRQLLKKGNGRVQKQFSGLIEKVVKGHQLLNGQIACACLKLSGAFSIAPFSEGKYVLANAQTRQVHSHIEKEEAGIIRLFEAGSTVKEAMLKSGYEEEPGLFNRFVHELVNEKILVIDGNEEEDIPGNPEV